jgi:molybdopterin converting factor small subunit
MLKSTVQCRVLFFSVLRDITGADEKMWVLQANATVADLLAECFATWPALKAWESSLLIALDHEYVKRSAVLRDQAEVAIMPPVQGG